MNSYLNAIKGACAAPSHHIYLTFKVRINLADIPRCTTARVDHDISLRET